MRLLDLRTGVLRRAAGRHEGPVVAMRFSPRGDRLVTAGGDERLIVWDPRRASVVERLAAGGTGLVQGLEITADGRTAYSGGRDGTVIAWDLTGERRWERRFDARGMAPARRSRLAVTADGSQFAVVAVDGVDLFDGRTLRRTGRLRPARGVPVGVALAPDGGTLAMTTERRDARALGSTHAATAGRAADRARVRPECAELLRRRPLARHGRRIDRAAVGRAPPNHGGKLRARRLQPEPQPRRHEARGHGPERPRQGRPRDPLGSGPEGAPHRAGPRRHGRALRAGWTTR